MSVITKDLGAATAYAYAVEKGYTGTEEEFAELMASYADVGQTAVDAKDAAVAAKTAAQTAATTATNKASEATTAAQTATTKAGEASTSASTATSAKDTAVSASQTATSKANEATTAAATATSAKTDAVAANTAAQSAKTAAQTAQTGAETAAASVSASAAQIATNTDDIAQLKSDLTYVTDQSGTTTEKTLGVIYAQWTNGAYTSAGYVSTNKWLKSKKLNKGIYEVSVPNDYRYQIYKYVSDSSGTLYASATSSDGLYDIDGSFIVSIGRNDASDLSGNDINTINQGVRIVQKDDSMSACLDDVKAQTHNFIDYANPLLKDFTGEDMLNIEWSEGAYNGSGYISSNAWLRSQKLSKGKYEIKIPSGYRYMIYKYVSDISGTQIVASTTTSGSYVFTDDFVISVSKELGGGLSYDEAKELKQYTVVIKHHTEKLPIQTENTQVDIWNATVTFPIGDGEFTHMTAYGNGVYKAYNEDDGVSRIRIALNTAFSPVGINKFIAKVYIPDSTKCQSLTLSPIGTSASIQHSGTLKDGWNDVTFYPFTADVTTWGSVTEIRITAGGTIGIEWYLAELTYVKKDVAWLLFIEDGGYNTFFENGYPDLKGLGIPTTLAYDCGTSGDWQIPIADVADLYDEGYLELSYHAWTPRTPTADMSASEIRSETAKCLRMLSENNMLPEHVWRAAHTQNLATNGLAQKGMVEALATWTGSGTPFNVFPFMNKWDVKRGLLQGKTTSELDFIFDVLQKTHCGAVMYAHGISNDSIYDVTPTIWDYFVGKLTTAVNAGWLKGTTYNELANGVIE